MKCPVACRKVKSSTKYSRSVSIIMEYADLKINKAHCNKLIVIKLKM